MENREEIDFLLESVKKITGIVKSLEDRVDNIEEMLNSQDL